jgi:hypothetical protein
LIEREGEKTQMGGVDQRDKKKLNLKPILFFFSLKLSGMLIQIISRREDYRLHIYRIIESTNLPFFFVVEK